MTRACEDCGCTETTACSGPLGNCWWVGDTLCNYCGDARDEGIGVDLEEDGLDYSEECGRWINGRLTNSCTLAGTEQCDFECPLQ